ARRSPTSRASTSAPPSAGATSCKRTAGPKSKRASCAPARGASCPSSCRRRTRDHARTMEAAIRTRGLRKIYRLPARKQRARATTAGNQEHSSAGPREIVALEALDLEIREGEFFGLLGPNGAGKTTTLGILTTRVRATSGKALVAGVEVSTQPERVRERIGVVPQRPNPDRSLRVRENLLFHAAYFGVPRPVAA